MRTLTRSLAAATAVLLASCSAASVPKAQPEPTLLLSTGSGIEGVTVGGVLRYRVAGGVATTDGSAVMATEGDRLVVRDARTGSTRRTVQVGPGLVVSNISPDGRQVALTTGPASSYLPAGRTETRLTVVELPSGTVTPFRLAGNLAPDAFSRSRPGLFLVSYLPAQAPDHYRITWLDLMTGEVNGVFGKNKEAPEDMRGLAGTKAVSPDHTTLYTLYLRPPAAGDTMQAEVHTLKLDQEWAHCIDLPPGLGGHDLRASTLAVAPDGKRLYVLDRVVRRLVEIDTDTLAIIRSVDLPLTARTGATSLVVSRDGHLYVSDGTGVLALRETTLAVDDGWQAPGPVTALAVVGDGRGLLVSSPGHVDRYDLDGGRHTSTVVPSDAVAISHLLT